ncbi:MAG: MATE family efflux transporter [Bacillota bacterium]|nr:MAG: MATE family efflux transporter [Bacillota bacterium]
MAGYSLTEGRIGSTLLRFAIPFLIANLLQSLYGAVDLFVVGQYADSAAVSAVAVGSHVMQTVTCLVTGLATGGTVLIGHRVGARDEEGTANAIGTLTVLFLIIAGILTPVMLLSSGPWITLMQTPAPAVHYAWQYLFACSWGMPFIIGYNVVSAIYRGLGDSRTPVYFIALACVVNVAADFLLVGGFHMGALGAAIATVAAQGISFLMALYYLRRRGFAFPFHRSHIRLDRPSALRILRVGTPLALQDFLVNVSFLVITAIVNTLGLIASAAVGVVEKIFMFTLLPPSAFSAAVAPMTAQNMGAEQPERAKQALWYGVGYSLAFGALVCACAQLFPEQLVGIFSRDGAVIAAGAEYLRAYSLDCILVSFVFNMNAYFSGCGKSMVAMVHSLLATALVRIPVSYFLSRGAQASLYGIGLAAPAASLFSLIVCAGYFLWLRRQPGDSLR